MEDLQQPTIQQLADLAMDIELTDPIDWGMLNIEEVRAYEMMASSVLESIYSITNEKQRMPVALASMTKLLVENFVLNLKLQNRIIEKGKHDV